MNVYSLNIQYHAIKTQYMYLELKPDDEIWRLDAWFEVLAPALPTSDSASTWQAICTWKIQEHVYSF